MAQRMNIISCTVFMLAYIGSFHFISATLSQEAAQFQAATEGIADEQDNFEVMQKYIEDLEKRHAAERTNLQKQYAAKIKAAMKEISYWKELAENYKIEITFLEGTRRNLLKKSEECKRQLEGCKKENTVLKHALQEARAALKRIQE